MTPCNHPGCHGQIVATGFCESCGHRPLSALPSAPFTVRGAGDGLFDLPVIVVSSPEDLVDPDPQPPAYGYDCRACRKRRRQVTVGAAYRGQPPLAEGYCPACRARFDFRAKLRPGEVVGHHYEVVGALANGGLGWVYLARDLNLEDHYVAVKGLLDSRDELALEQAVQERRHLARLSHDNIVRIVTHARHPAPDGGESTGYIVMEFVGGLSLAQVMDLMRKKHPHFDTPRVHEHILAYGYRILQALDHLHTKELAYCDMKPDNVMHHLDRVKLIDLGAVHDFGDTDGEILGTEPYESPEVQATGPSRRTDLHTVGVTLKRLAQATGQRLPGLGGESFTRLWQRARAADPARRFATAEEMAVQLRGVLREIRSLRREGKDYEGNDYKDYSEPSTLFGSTTELLESSLGSAPPLQRWLGNGRHEEITHGRPAPPQVAAGLSVPFPHAESDVEVLLRACRTQLRRGDFGNTRGSLDRAAELLDDAQCYDWRIPWHRGLLALAQHDVKSARLSFDEVYRALPGEYAPKLALGYCAECLGQRDQAWDFYQAVWRRNRAQINAAFGLTRLRLAAGDRERAAAIVEAVPKDSLHYEAARTAAVRIRLRRLRGEHGMPAKDDLLAVVRSHPWPELHLDAGHGHGPVRDRLTAEVREAALTWFRDPGRTEGAEGLGHGELLGDPVTEDGLRRRLAASYRDLAAQAHRPDQVETLVDLANRTRPAGWGWWEWRA